MQSLRSVGQLGIRQPYPVACALSSRDGWCQSRTLATWNQDLLAPVLAKPEVRSFARPEIRHVPAHRCPFSVQSWSVPTSPGVPRGGWSWRPFVFETKAAGSGVNGRAA